MKMTSGNKMKVKIEKNVPIPLAEWEKIKEYKKMHIETMIKLNKGESIVIKDRVKETIKHWTNIATYRLLKEKNRASNHFLSRKIYKETFLIKSIDKKTHRVWRVK